MNFKENLSYLGPWYHYFNFEKENIITGYYPNYPDFLDIQIKSFQDFFQLETKSDERNEEGLFNTFKENFAYLFGKNIVSTISNITVNYTE